MKLAETFVPQAMPNLHTSLHLFMPDYHWQICQLYAWHLRKSFLYKGNVYYSFSAFLPKRILISGRRTKSLQRRTVWILHRIDTLGCNENRKTSLSFCPNWISMWLGMYEHQKKNRNWRRRKTELFLKWIGKFWP